MADADFAVARNKFATWAAARKKRFGCINLYMQLTIVVKRDFWQNEAKLCSAFNGC
jgi:hypothetical protein